MQEKSKPVDNLRADAEKIITRAIAAVLPDAAVARALKGKTYLGRVYLVAAGTPCRTKTPCAARTPRSR